MTEQSKVPSNFYPIAKWAGIFIIIGGIKVTSNLILPIILALFISLMLLQPVHWFESKKIPRSIAIVIVLSLFASILIILGDLIGTSINNFKYYLPEFKETLIQKFSDGKNQIDLFGFKFSDDSILNAKPGKYMDLMLNGLDHIRQIIGKMFFILLLTLFLLFELDSFPIKFKAIFSRKGTMKAKININRITINLKSYLFIKTVTSFFTGLFIFIGLKLLGVEFAILWGTIAFLLNYIPNIGSLLAAIPAVVLTGIQLGGTSMLIAGILYLVVNFIIGSVIEPRIMGKGMGLSTAVILLSLMFWGWLFGPIGMFLSVPLTMVLKVFLQSSESSKYFAILIGTEKEALQIIEQNNKEKSV
jgi:predicted PurR-regulated permease PerM